MTLEELEILLKYKNKFRLLCSLKLCNTNFLFLSDQIFLELRLVLRILFEWRKMRLLNWYVVLMQSLMSNKSNGLEMVDSLTPTLSTPYPESRYKTLAPMFAQQTMASVRKVNQS